MSDYKVTIENSGYFYEPLVEGEVSWQQERKGVPGRLEFQVVKEGALDFQEGNPVRFEIDGEPIFFGFVFTKKRSSDGRISVTAYDQLRYLKNKDSYLFKGKTAAEMLKSIAADFRLQCGELPSGGYVVPQLAAQDKTLFDIIQTAFDETLSNTGQLLVLYDNMGKLCIKNAGDWLADYLVADDSAQDFDYSSSIDGETYNKIKLTKGDEKTGKQQLFIVKDSERLNQWGALQYTGSVGHKENGKEKAEALMKLYNQKTRQLSISKAFGDIRVRAGCHIGVALDLGDIVAKNFMLVEKVKHSFSYEGHFMDLTLRGGVINSA